MSPQNLEALLSEPAKVFRYQQADAEATNRGRSSRTWKPQKTKRDSQSDSLSRLMKEAIQLRTLRPAATVMLLAIISLTLSGCLGNLFGAIETYTVSGTVIDSADQPIQGVQIVYTSGRSGSTVTGNDGSFTITGVVGSITIAPVSNSYTFDPSNRTVSDQTSSADFVGTPDHEGHRASVAEDFVIQYLEGTLATLDDHLAPSMRHWQYMTVDNETGAPTWYTAVDWTPENIDNTFYSPYLAGLASAFLTGEISAVVTDTSSMLIDGRHGVRADVSVTMAGNLLGPASVDLFFAHTDDGTALGDWRIDGVGFNELFGYIETVEARATHAVTNHVIPLLNAFGHSMESDDAAANAALYYSGSSIQSDDSGVTVMTNSQVLQAVQSELAQRNYTKYEITPTDYTPNSFALMNIESMLVEFERTYQIDGGLDVVETGSFTLVNVAQGPDHDWQILTFHIDGQIR